MLLLPLQGAFLVIGLAMFVVKVYALIDCLRASEGAFVSAGKQTKQFWIIVLAVAIAVSILGFLSVLGFIAALVYLLDVRPAVRGGGSTYGGW